MKTYRIPYENPAVRDSAILSIGHYNLTSERTRCQQIINDWAVICRVNSGIFATIFLR